MPAMAVFSTVAGNQAVPDNLRPWEQTSGN